jgi:hypothetical protein
MTSLRTAAFEHVAIYTIGLAMDSSPSLQNQWNYTMHTGEKCDTVSAELSRSELFFLYHKRYTPLD